MKNRLTRTFSIVFVILLLVCAWTAITVSATEAEELPSATVLSKNLEYGKELYLYFAIDDTEANGEEIEVLIYTEDPTANTSATTYKATKSTLVYTPDPTKPVYRSFGIPASGVVDEFYIVPRIVGYDIDYSKMVTYSVIEYLLDMRLTATDPEDVDLYNALITYATAAQNKFDYKTDTLAKDFVYAEVANGLFANGKNSIIGIKGLETTVTYQGTVDKGYKQEGWNYTDDEGATVPLSSTDTVVLDSSMIINANIVLDKPYINFNDGTLGDAKASSFTDGYTSYSVENSALHVVNSASHSSNTAQIQVFTDVADEGGNCYSFETDINVASEGSGSGGCLYQITFYSSTKVMTISLYGAWGDAEQTQKVINIKDSSGNLLYGGTDFDMDADHNLRIEFYSDKKTAVIYLDNIAIAETSNCSSDKVDITRINFALYRTQRSNAYLDNMLLEQKSQSYESTTVE